MKIRGGSKKLRVGVSVVPNGYVKLLNKTPTSKGLAFLTKLSASSW